MNFLRRGSSAPEKAAPEKSGSEDGGVQEPRDTVTVGGDARRAQTAGKGRPTPSRRDAEGRKRGPVAPAPRTQREAMRRSKEQRGSKEDRRKAAADRRARMNAGDDSVLPVRDRGPLKAHVRDLVDARRNLMGLFMPIAVIMFVLVFIQVPAIQSVATTVALLMMLAMAIEGTLLGRQVTARIRTRFPQQQIKGLSIGWYAFTRATQLRKLRMPAPRVTPGTAVA